MIELLERHTGAKSAFGSRTLEDVYPTDSALFDDVKARQQLLTLINEMPLSELGQLLTQKVLNAEHEGFDNALQHCQSIEQGLYVISQYLTVKLLGIEITLVKRTNEYRLLIDDFYWQQDFHQLVIQVVVSMLIRHLHTLTEKFPELSIKYIAFDFEKTSKNQNDKLYKGVDLYFEQTFCAMNIHISSRRSNTRKIKSERFLQAIELCEFEKRAYLETALTTQKVWHLISQSSGASIPSLNEIAHLLNTSSRTLHRELLKEQTSFSALVNNFQASKSKQLLLSYQYSVQEVGQLLGYSDVANFRRAFKRWYKCSPIEFIRLRSK